MAYSWINQFIVPLIKVTFLIGVVGGVIGFFGLGLWRWYSRSFKFFLIYTIFRTQYDPEIVEWCVKASENGMNWYDAKKSLLVAGTKNLYEVLWIFSKIQGEMIAQDRLQNNGKGGGKNNGRIVKGGNSSYQATKLPEIKRED